MIIRKANSNDWDNLYPFFKGIYREKHPLQSEAFWEWQYGDENYGVSFICLNENNEIIAHLGAGFGGEIAWTLNLYVNPDYRGKGISEKLHVEVRKYYPLAAISASKKGLKVYKRMGWIRYYNLMRYVKINPNIENKIFEEVCKAVKPTIDHLITKETHYSRQPSIKCLKLKGNSIAVSQIEVGGLRAIDIENVKELEAHAWELGYNWIDYVSSWNDPKINTIEKAGWVIDNESVVPWLLNPKVKGRFSDISFLSEKPLDTNFIVHRSYSDHGRIGSL